MTNEMNMTDEKIYKKALTIVGMTYHMNSDFISKKDYLHAVYSELQQEESSSESK